MSDRSLPRTVSSDQAAALDAFSRYLDSADEHVFILSGAAGTGKTTLLGRMMEAVRASRLQGHLAALTGRAATIARARTGREATTLHSFLYRFDPRSSKVVDGVPQLVFSVRDVRDQQATVLFVDEASMLGSAKTAEPAAMQFGSGHLVTDLLGFWFGGGRPAGTRSKLVLVGDPYQLPPVGDRLSIAFDIGAWDSLIREASDSPMRTVRAELTTVHRQGKGGVLDLATRYRNAIEAGDYRTTPMPPEDDVEVRAHATAGASLAPFADEIADNPASQVVIAYTNASVAAWNRRVRQQRWGSPDTPIRAGDLVVSTRLDPHGRFDAGEILQIERADTQVRVIAHLGREVRLREVALTSSFRGEALVALLADGTLDSPDRTMSREDFQVLWVDFTQRHRGLRDNSPEFWDAVRRDPVLNPIVAKYGYALTGHKAQGGQWDRVVVDFANSPVAPDSEEGFRWAYTAITRGRSVVDLIDPPYRSPFSRLASTGSTASLVSENPNGSAGLSAAERRERAESAVTTWANSRDLPYTVIDRKDYSTRFELARDGRAVVFDLFFDKDGIATKRLPVRSGMVPDEDLLPPLSLLERASMEGMARPTDPRVADALLAVENAIRASGLTVHFRRALQWAVELEVGSAEDGGVLVLSFRKSGVFSAKSWKRPPSEATRSMVDSLLETLARG